MSEASSQQLVVFSLGSEEYALPIGEPGKIVIVSSGAGQFGVVIGRVPTANRDSIEAIAKVDDRLVVLLEAEGLFAREAELVAAAA
jgi:chemotaxis signal transduction protein